MNEDLQKSISDLSRIISMESNNSEDEIRSKFTKEIQPYITQFSDTEERLNSLKKALRYLVYTHAFTSREPSVNTYLSFLEVLMEIVYPTAVQMDDSLLFLDDLEGGLKRSRELAD